MALLVHRCTLNGFVEDVERQALKVAQRGAQKRTHEKVLAERRKAAQAKSDQLAQHTESLTNAIVEKVVQLVAIQSASCSS